MEATTGRDAPGLANHPARMTQVVLVPTGVGAQEALDVGGQVGAEGQDDRPPRVVVAHADLHAR